MSDEPLKSDEQARFLTFVYNASELIDAYLDYLNGAFVKDTEVAVRYTWNEENKVGVVVVAVGRNAEGWMAMRDRELSGQGMQ